MSPQAVSLLTPTSRTFTPDLPLLVTNTASSTHEWVDDHCTLTRMAEATKIFRGIKGKGAAGGEGGGRPCQPALHGQEPPAAPPALHPVDTRAGSRTPPHQTLAHTCNDTAISLERAIPAQHASHLG